MEIKPVKETKPPVYPRKEEVQAEQIKQNVPLRWAKSPAAKIALASLAAMSLAGCEPPRTAGVPIAPSPTTEETAEATASVTDAQVLAGVPIAPSPSTEETVTPTPVVLDGDVMAPVISVAPLFLHGEGLGAFGCVMVSPPAFLSEDEALFVINNVAKDYGLKFGAADSLNIEGVRQPVTNVYGADEPVPSDTYITFTPDFIDTERGISIEFVSTQDMQTWNRGEQAVSGSSYDTRDAAAQLSEALEDAYAQDNKTHTVGVVYDPLARVEPKSEEMSSQASADSIALEEQQLAAQVKDFCEWLKEQGII